MIRTLLCFIGATLALTAADRTFLMLGGLTQIVDASGKASWKYPAVTRDGEVLPNGNLLLTLSKTKAYPGGAVVEVTRDQKVVWEYKGTQTEVNTAVLLDNGNVMLTEAGDKPRLLEVARDGSIKVQIPLGCQITNHHMQSRMAPNYPTVTISFRRKRLCANTTPPARSSGNARARSLNWITDPSAASVTPPAIRSSALPWATTSSRWMSRGKSSGNSATVTCRAYR